MANSNSGEKPTQGEAHANQADAQSAASHANGSTSESPEAPASSESPDSANRRDDNNLFEGLIDQADGLGERSEVRAQPLEAAGELEQLRAQLRATQEQMLRGMADMENLRKRTANEVASAHKFAVESFAESLVPVLDSLELSLKVDKPSIETLKEGAEATLRLLHAAFEKNHLLAIEPVGERFDPNRHQAISMVPGNSVTPSVAPNHIVSVLQKGYLIHDRVLRPALVTVAKA